MQSKEGADIYVMNDDNHKLLALAIENQRVEEAALLLEKGALVEEKFHSFLFKAIKTNNHIILKMLIDHGMRYHPLINLNVYFKMAMFLENPLMIEAILPHCRFSVPSDQYIPRKFVVRTDPGSKYSVELLLKWNFTINPDSYRDNDFICKAVENGFLPIVVQLVEHGINVNMNSRTGLNLLTVACLNEHHEIVEHLLQHGANINMKISSTNKRLNDHSCFSDNMRVFKNLSSSDDNKNDLINITCLHIAVFNSDWMTTDILLKHGVKSTDDTELFNLTCVAAKNSCEEIVRVFLDHGVKVTDTNFNGKKTFLHFCVHSDHDKKDYSYNVAKFLLEKGADIHLKTPKNTLVFDAINNEHRKTAQLFLDWNADIQFISPVGDTLLHMAIKKKFNVEFIETLLKLNSPVNTKNTKGLTPLHVACKKQSKYRLEITKALLNHGADINCTGVNSETPLLLACNNLDPELVIFLIKKGVNFNVKDHHDETPLHYVCRHGGDIIPSLIQLFLEHNANIEAANDSGWTPLFLACREGNYLAVECLLNNHANPNATNDDKETPLHAICYFQSDVTVRVIQLLLQYGANIEAADNGGRTPLLKACERANPIAIKCFLDNNANLHAVDNSLRTPLHYVCLYFSYKETEIIKLLLEWGANLEVVDVKGWTPLFVACVADNIKTVEYLLINGANLEHTDLENSTPLHIAVREHSKTVVENLIKYGVNINILNKNNKTALQEVLDIRRSLDDTHMPTTLFRRIVTLKCQVVKLKVAGLKVHNQNLNITYDSDRRRVSLHIDINNKIIGWDIKHLEVHCQQEIERMKKQYVGIDNLTFYDLLIKPVHMLSKLIGKQNIQQTLDLEVFDTKFPLYKDIIKSRIREATIRHKKKELMDSAREYFRLNISQRLPDECIDMVLDYLYTGTLNIFIRAMEPSNCSFDSARSIEL